MFGASSQRDDFPAARIFYWRFLTSFFLPEQQFQNYRKKNFCADLQTKIDTHLHLKSKLYSAFIHQSRNMQQIFMPPLGWRVMYHFHSHTFRVIIKTRRWYTSVDVAMSHLNDLFHDATFKWTEYSVINKTLDISASKTILSSWVKGNKERS